MRLQAGSALSTAMQLILVSHMSLVLFVDFQKHMLTIINLAFCKLSLFAIMKSLSLYFQHYRDASAHSSPLLAAFPIPQIQMAPLPLEEARAKRKHHCTTAPLSSNPRFGETAERKSLNSA